MRLANNTVSAVLEQYQQDLASLHPPGEVRAIISAVFFDRLGWDAMQLIDRRKDPLSESELLQVYLPLKRLRNGEPLQYVLGSTTFHGLTIGVDPSVLIPRPETEELVGVIVQHQASPPARILDIGTGSGCIALALKKAFPSSEVFGMDISPMALQCAQANSGRNALEVCWVLADVLNDADHAIPDGSGIERTGAMLMVSNPPYITKGEAASIEPHVRDHEPHLALFVDDVDPLVFYRAIAQLAWRLQRPGDQLWFEGHRDHASDVASLLERTGFVNVEVRMDLQRGTTLHIRAAMNGLRPSVLAILFLGAVAAVAQIGDGPGTKVRAGFKVLFNFDARRTIVFDEPVRFLGIRLGAQRGKDIIALGYYGLDKPWVDHDVRLDDVGLASTEVHTTLNYVGLTYERILIDTKRWQLSAPVMIGLGMAEQKYLDSANVYRPYNKEEVIAMETGLRGAYKLFFWLYLQAGAGYRKVSVADRNIDREYSGLTWSYGVSIKLGEIYRYAKRKQKERRDGTQ